MDRGQSQQEVSSQGKFNPCPSPIVVTDPHEMDGIYKRKCNLGFPVALIHKVSSITKNKP